MRHWSKRKTSSISLTRSTYSIEKCNISRISTISVRSSWINNKVSENNLKNERRSANWLKRFEPQTGGLPLNLLRLGPQVKVSSRGEKLR